MTLTRFNYLAPQNRPPQLRQPHGPPPNHNNGNFRPQMHQRLPGPPQQRPQNQMQQKGPAPKIQPPPQQQKQPPPQQLLPQAQQQKPPPQQQLPPQQQQLPPLISPPNESVKGEQMCDVIEDQNKRKPFWATKTGNTGKISRKERQRRRNLRLSKILQPKNAVMILNELVKSATYTVSDLPLPSEMNQYTANVLVDGVSHIGHGRSKMEAKSMAAEAALKYIVKNRQFSAFKKEDCDDKMELGEDGSPTLPWQHVASFALFKLLNSWGEDPNQARGLSFQMQETTSGQPPQNKPAKKLPDNAAHMNPLMLLNQMLPQAQFEELGRNGNPPNVIFTFKCTVNGQSFNGTGSNKKSAKKMAAFAACHKILEIDYPLEIYTPAN
ncbi:double-stranded RNA-specific editase Adar-like isoform X4 [Tenebrio molitor]|uniref:double-stranded RNA-specific editase Adar-like isoform X4 n=1 Tax=Tenebrio molitor TaxID=7067 RepID=UPI003624A885